MKRDVPAAAAPADGWIELSDDLLLLYPTRLRGAHDRSVRIAFVERDGRQLGLITWRHGRGWCATSIDVGFMGFHHTALSPAKIVLGSRP